MFRHARRRMLAVVGAIVLTMVGLAACDDFTLPSPARTESVTDSPTAEAPPDAPAPDAGGEEGEEEEGEEEEGGTVLPPGGLSASMVMPLGPGHLGVESECSVRSKEANFNTNHMSDLVSAPFTRPAMVPSGKFANVYLWDTAVTPEGWDAHMAKLASSSTPGTPGGTVAGIDNLVADLTSSCYFDSLTQYGIQPPQFLGHVDTVPMCVANALKDMWVESPGATPVLQWDTLRSFAMCEKNHHTTGPDFDQVNIFVSPDIAVGKVSPFGPSRAICGTGLGAWHAWGLDVPDYAVMPTNMGCSANLNALIGATAHEMTEIVTDPAGLGWLAEGSSSRVNAIIDGEVRYNNGEISDICQSGRKSLAPDHGTTTPFLTTNALPTYWSNAEALCVPTWLPNTLIAQAHGDPAIRFTGQDHELVMNLDPAADRSPGKVLTGLLVRIVTGGDNLNGGSSDGDNVDLVLQTTRGELVWRNLNYQSGWSDHTLHAALVSVPEGLRVSDISKVTLRTGFRGGDNWNVDDVTVLGGVELRTVGWTDVTDPTVAVTATTSPVTIPLSSRLNPNQAISRLQFIVTTGKEELQGDQRPIFTARLVDGTILTTPDPFVFSRANTNDSQGRVLRHQTAQRVITGLPAGTTAGDIESVTVHVQSGQWPLVSVRVTGSDHP